MVVKGGHAQACVKYRHIIAPDHNRRQPVCTTAATMRSPQHRWGLLYGRVCMCVCRKRCCRNAMAGLPYQWELVDDWAQKRNQSRVALSVSIVHSDE